MKSGKICKNSDHTCLFHCINACRVPRTTFEHGAWRSTRSNNFLGSWQMLMHENTCVIPIFSFVGFLRKGLIYILLGLVYFKKIETFIRRQHFVMDKVMTSKIKCYCICTHNISVAWWITAWVKIFRINPDFRILRLTFHRKSASNAELGRL